MTPFLKLSYLIGLLSPPRKNEEVNLKYLEYEHGRQCFPDINMGNTPAYPFQCTSFLIFKRLVKFRRLLQLLSCCDSST